MERPKIRPVEAFPVEHEGQTTICLRDPAGLAPQPILLGMGAYFLATLFDGRHSRVDIQEIYARRFGEILLSEKLEELIAALDQTYFLDSPGFASHLNEVRDEFRA